jgi:hypothetical protein
LNRSVAWQLWVIGAILPVALILAPPFGRYDFAALWVAGAQAVAGQADRVYDIAATQAYADLLDLGGATIFPYPPHALFLFAPFALIPYLPSYVLWNVLTAGLFYRAVRPYWPEGLPRILSILTPAALVCVDFGQTGLLFGALWLFAFSGRWPAVAALTFKPHLGFLSILSIKSWKALLLTAALAALLLLLSVALFGLPLWKAFIDHSIHHAADIGTRKRWLFAGVTPAIGYGFVGWIPFAAAGALLLARRVNAFTASTASFLISPYGFHYDMTVAALGFGLIAYLHWDRMPVSHRIPVALGFLSPVIASAGAWWIPPLLLWALWAQTKYDPVAGKAPSN